MHIHHYHVQNPNERDTGVMISEIMLDSSAGNYYTYQFVEIYNNPKNMGNILEKYFTTQGEEPSPEEQQVLQQAQAPQQQGPPNLAALLGGAIG